MFEDLLSRLSPDELKELHRLSDEAKRTRLEFVEILKRESYIQKHSKLVIARAREEKLIAQKAKVEAYKALGLDHRRFWQFDNISRGLCRFCGAPQDKGNLCAECRKGQWREKQ